MDPKPFHTLTQEQARAYLAEFLSAEGRILDETIRLRCSSGHQFGAAREYMVEYFEEFDPAVRPKYRPWENRLPEFLKQLPEHEKGESYFEQDANICLLRMGYYFGECLIREFPKLKWAVGNRKYAHSGKPVVAGFGKGLECAAIHVCETVMARVDRIGLGFDEFLTTLEVWRVHAMK